jgi:hypothetical protein
MIAVGTSHRLFMARHLGHSSPCELKRLAIHQYNKAIALILPLMSTKSASNMHCILICCLLFISFEGLTGRYNELLRHLDAGVALFHSLKQGATAEEYAVTEKLAEMFCRLGVESSNFMKEPTLSELTKWYCNNSGGDDMLYQPFANLDEASYELRRLDLQYQEKPWHLDGDTDQQIGGTLDRELSSTALQKALFRWNLRFEASFEADSLMESRAQYLNLRLHQNYWQMSINAFSSEEAASNPETFAPFMAIAETVAAPFIAMSQPTFSLDGQLISGLAFVASTTLDDDTKLRALDLLRSLNRREGMLDSNDFVEMHELFTYAQSYNKDAEVLKKKVIDFDLFFPNEIAAGIPDIIARLRKNIHRDTV